MSNRKLRELGDHLTGIGSGMLLLATDSKPVGAAIYRQWIKDLRFLATEMEKEMENGEGTKASGTAADISGDAGINY